MYRHLYTTYLQYKRIHLNDKISLHILERKMEKFNKVTIYYSILIKED